MTDKKKKYLAPEITVVEIEQADIIATSGEATFGFNDGEGYTEERRICKTLCLAPNGKESI